MEIQFFHLSNYGPLYAREKNRDIFIFVPTKRQRVKIATHVKLYLSAEVSVNNLHNISLYRERCENGRVPRTRPSRSSSLLCKRSTKDIVINHLFVMKLSKDGRTRLTDLFPDNLCAPVIIGTSFAPAAPV